MHSKECPEKLVGLKKNTVDSIATGTDPSESSSNGNTEGAGIALERNVDCKYSL